MSHLDEYEHRRGPVRRRKFRGGAKRGPKQKRPLSSKEIQLALQLLGGTTAKDKGEPFNDDIDHIGRK